MEEMFEQDELFKSNETSDILINTFYKEVLLELEEGQKIAFLNNQNNVAKDILRDFLVDTSFYGVRETSRIKHELFRNKIELKYGETIYQLDLFKEMFKAFNLLSSQILSKKEDFKSLNIHNLLNRTITLFGQSLIMLKNGYPSGVATTYRSIFETICVLQFLLENDEDISRKYHFFFEILYLRFEKRCVQLYSDDAKKQKELIQIKDNYKLLKKEYESHFPNCDLFPPDFKEVKNDWHWAKQALKENPSFEEIRKSLNKSDSSIEAYYYSSNYIHSNNFSIMDKRFHKSQNKYLFEKVDSGFYIFMSLSIFEIGNVMIDIFNNHLKDDMDRETVEKIKLITLLYETLEDDFHDTFKERDFD